MRACRTCGRELTATRRFFCSMDCNKAHWRAKGAVEPPTKLCARCKTRPRAALNCRTSYCRECRTAFKKHTTQRSNMEYLRSMAVYPKGGQS